MMLVLAAPPAIHSIDNATFKVPEGFTWDAREGTDHATLTRFDGDAYCVVSIYKSVARNADLSAQWATDWKNPVGGEENAPAPIPTKRKVGGGASALEGAGPAFSGGQHLWADLLDIDAGGKVVTIVFQYSDKAATVRYRAAVDAWVAGLVVKASAPGALPVSAAAPPAAVNTVTLASTDLVGHWTKGDGSSVSLVNSYTGAYAGSSTVLYTVQYDFHANGTYDYAFDGVSNGRAAHSKETGVWAVGGDGVSIMPKTGEKSHFRLIAFAKGSDGGKLLTVARDDLQPGAATGDLHEEKWTYAPEKK